MAIKYLRGIYRFNEVRNTRPLPGFRFPLGIEVGAGLMDTANSIATTDTSTFDVLLVGGGGSGGQRGAPSGVAGSAGGGGGAGGFRLLSANNLTEIDEFKKVANISPTNDNFIPVIVGGTSRFGLTSDLLANGGGGGGPGADGAPGVPGGTGGSGGGGGGTWSGRPAGGAGAGIAGQGFPGGSSGGPGGSASGASRFSGGITTNFTGTSILFSNGGGGGRQTTGLINRGEGGGGGAPPSGSAGGMAGGSGIVAIRYRNPAAPTTPLATGGNDIICTGGCIIHLYTTSGLFNVSTQFSIN